MWGLHSLLFPDSLLPERHALPKTPETDWLTRYRGNRDHDFPHFPGFSDVGVDWVDELLMRIGNDLNAFLARGRELFGTYGNLNKGVRIPAELDDPSWSSSDVERAAHDFWPATIVIGLQALSEQLASDPNSPSALSAMREVKNYVDGLARSKATREEKIEKLLGVLSLPVWKKREAMYSVWVCAAALLDPRDCRVDYHVGSGRLEFPFRPRKIATITQPERPNQRIEFWSELRTPANDLVGKRKSAIQPDYRYQRFGRDNKPIDVLLLECKQYKKSNVSNFAAAIIDYARASPGAEVLLCNYGPMLPSVKQRVQSFAPEISDRVEAIGDIRPENDGEFRLRKCLRSALEQLIIPPGELCWPPGEILIELTWDSKNTDLDLHLKQGDTWVNFQTPNGILGASYREDQRGEQHLRSREQVRFQPRGAKVYSILVHRYSGDFSLQQVGAEIKIFHSAGFEDLIVPEGAGDWWYVADLRLGSSAPIVVGRIIESPRAQVFI